MLHNETCRPDTTRSLPLATLIVASLHATPAAWFAAYYGGYYRPRDTLVERPGLETHARLDAGRPFGEERRSNSPIRPWYVTTPPPPFVRVPRPSRRVRQNLHDVLNGSTAAGGYRSAPPAWRRCSCA